MIPKIIHYCWLSNDPIPEDLQKCMESWKKYLPDYEFMLWNFDRFPKSQSKWVSDAFDNKKYAFAADYIRIYALYLYGGFYLDMDVEVVKPFEPFLNLNTMLGYENSKNEGLEVAAFGVEKNSPWIKKCLDFYEARDFINQDGSFNVQPLPGVIRRCLERNGFELFNVHNIKEAKSVSNSNAIPVFPCDFFSPKNHVNGKIYRTSNTYSIHHFAGSWLPWYFRMEQRFWESIGLRDMRIILRCINLFTHGTIRSNVTPIEKVDK